jgi:hypothetical protein
MTLKNDVNVPSKSNKQKIISVDVLKVTDEIAGSGSGCGSISQRYGSEDPDPYKNFMDPQHWQKE